MASQPPAPPAPKAPAPPGPMTGGPKKTWVTAPQRRAPEKVVYINPAEFSFEYWFNYFYAELPSHKRLEFFTKVSPSEGVFRAANAVPDVEKKALLDDMMKLGFRAYPDTLGPNGKLTAEDMFKSLKTMTRPEPSRVMFRGDSREPKQIEANAGTKPQTQLDHLRGSRNFDKSWHPWNDKARGKLAYFRNGEINQDNCLFSAISVTPEFFVATKFPMLPQGPIGKATVEVEDLAVQGNSVAALRTQFERKTKTVTLPCTRTNIYAVKVKKGWNTESFQAQTFPERAYDNLRWVDHFAVVKVTRIHFSDNSNDGHLTIIDDWTLLPNDNDFDAHVRSSMKKLNATSKGTVDRLIIDLREFLRRTYHECRLLNGVGGKVYLPEGVRAPFKITKVNKIEF